MRCKIGGQRREQRDKTNKAKERVVMWAGLKVPKHQWHNLNLTTSERQKFTLQPIQTPATPIKSVQNSEYLNLYCPCKATIVTTDPSGFDLFQTDRTDSEPTHRTTYNMCMYRCISTTQRIGNPYKFPLSAESLLNNTTSRPPSCHFGPIYIRPAQENGLLSH